MFRSNDDNGLAVVLFCFAGAMAIILWAVEKKPVTVTSLLTLMVALLIYPILHFVKTKTLRAVSAFIVVAATVVLGWYVWPKSNNVVPLVSTEVVQEERPPVKQTEPVRPPAASEQSQNTKEPAAPPSKPSNKKVVKPSTPGLIAPSQNNSGGINVQQLTTGDNSPISNSPITVNPPVNSNKRVITYRCSGVWNSVGPGQDAAIEYVTCLPNRCDKVNVFNEMVELNNAKKYSELAQRCEREIVDAPEWLTPYLFCGLAYAGTGDSQKMRERLAYYDEHTGPAYTTDQGCKQMSDVLHNLRTQQQP